LEDAIPPIHKEEKNEKEKTFGPSVCQWGIQQTQPCGNNKR
jgi:hypothetical protein